MMNQMVSLQAETMEIRFTNQQDTTKVKTPVVKLPGMHEAGQLKIDRTALLPIVPLPERQTEMKKADTLETAPAPTPPTRAQQRYWWWQQESKLLVGDSRYMEPYNESRLIVPSENGNSGLQLPVRKINQTNYDWLTLVLLIALVLFASVRTIWNKYVVSLFHSVVNYATSIRMFQEKNTSVTPAAFQLDLLFYLIFSAFTFQLIHFFNINLPFSNLKLFIFSTGLILSYFLFKKLIYRIIGFLIEKNGETAEYLFNMNNFTRIAGIVLFPVVAIIAFYPFDNLNVPITAGIILVTAIYFLLIIRGFVILLKKQFSIFYLFLYFCTLEFLPLVLLYKILVV
jgi:hypothetical protein